MSNLASKVSRREPNIDVFGGRHLTLFGYPAALLEFNVGNLCRPTMYENAVCSRDPNTYHDSAVAKFRAIWPTLRLSNSSLNVASREPKYEGHGLLAVATAQQCKHSTGSRSNDCVQNCLRTQFMTAAVLRYPCDAACDKTWPPRWASAVTNGVTKQAGRIRNRRISLAPTTDFGPGPSIYSPGLQGAPYRCFFCNFCSRTSKRGPPDGPA